MDARELSSKGRLAASSLLESVLALGLLAAAMSIAVLLHFETITSDHAPARLEAWSMTEEAVSGLESTGKAGTFVASDGMHLTIKTSMLGRGCERAHLTCWQGETIVLERNVIIVLP